MPIVEQETKDGAAVARHVFSLLRAGRLPQAEKQPCGEISGTTSGGVARRQPAASLIDKLRLIAILPHDALVCLTSLRAAQGFVAEAHPQQSLRRNRTTAVFAVCHFLI